MIDKIDPQPHLPECFQEFYWAQQGFGWQQLYYDCLLPLWVTLINQHCPTVNGLHYSTKQVKLIQFCASGNYGTNNFILGKTSRKTVLSCKPQSTKLSMMPNKIPFFVTQWPMLIQTSFWPNQSTSSDTNSHNHMQAQLKVAKLQAKLHTHNICHFSIAPITFQ